MKTKISLEDIPLAIFREFAITDKSTKQTFTDGGHQIVVRTCLAEKKGPNSRHTLVHHNYIDGYGKRNTTKFEVHRHSVTSVSFNPSLEFFKPKPLLTILFCAQDFDTQEPLSSTLWKEGSGYWVQEYLKVLYGSGSNSLANIVSNQNDWEFKFFLDIQTFAHELAHGVESRGHWQIEWNPRGDYSCKPENYVE